MSDVGANHHGLVVELLYQHYALHSEGWLGRQAETHSRSNRHSMGDPAQLGVNLHGNIAEVLEETLVVGTNLHGLETLGDNGLHVSSHRVANDMRLQPCMEAKSCLPA